MRFMPSSPMAPPSAVKLAILKSQQKEISHMQSRQNGARKYPTNERPQVRNRKRGADGRSKSSWRVRAAEESLFEKCREGSNCGIKRRKALGSQMPEVTHHTQNEIPASSQGVTRRNRRRTKKVVKHGRAQVLRPWLKAVCHGVLGTPFCLGEWRSSSNRKRRPGYGNMMLLQPGMGSAIVNAASVSAAAAAAAAAY